MEDKTKGLSEYATVQGHAIEFQSKNKCDIVMDKIIEYIAAGEYKPDDRLPPESFFTEYFNVSRVTIRESIKKLSSMGVVTVKHGQGTFVNKITPSTFMLQLYPLMMLNKNDVSQLYEARIYLESDIAELAAKNRTKEEIEKLRGLIHLMEECIKESQFEKYNGIDMEFHTLIGVASKNDLLVTMYKMLNEVRKRGIYMSNASVEALRHSIKSHIKLLEAIENKDCERSRKLMIEHLDYSRTAAVEKIK